MLPSYDQSFLDERHPGWSQVQEGGMLCVVLPGFRLPPGFTLGASNLLLRLSTGYSLEDFVEAVQELEPGDFIKSETAHNPPNSKVWHDTYNMPWDGRWLYLKFAGETLIDVTLTSFKEVGND